MIKEYINELLLENDEKLNNLEQQLKSLMNDQDCAEKWLETLQSESNLDKNIFSPRAMDTDLKKKTEDARENINKTKQDIEYVKSFIETHLVKKQEYEKLLAELDEMNSDKDQKQEEKNNGEIQNNDDLKEDKGSIQISNFLSDLYKKTDLCLNLLYNDRVKCKNELKNMKSMIKHITDSLQENI